MNLIEITDNTKISETYLDTIRPLIDIIADKTLKQLSDEKSGNVIIFPDVLKSSRDISDDDSKKKYILRRIGGNYETGNFMGFFGFGDSRLNIKSRFDSKDNDFFLQYMLERALQLPNVINLKTEREPDRKFFDILVFLFFHYLKAAMRKGMFKTYVRRQYNDSSVKGIIEIARHIKQNTPFIGNVAYSRREYDYDNFLTELIRHTVEYIKGKPYGGNILAALKEEIRLITSITSKYCFQDRTRIIEQNRKNIVRHAYYREYRTLQSLCIMILRHEKHKIGSGSREINGILFDGSWLWEEYLNTLLNGKFYHPNNKAKKNAQRLFDRNIGKIYPDFIGNNPDKRIIADAKYKPVNNIQSDDYKQILTYMFRFDAKTGYFLYPYNESGSISTEKENAGGETLHLLQGVTYEHNVKPRNDICVIKKALKIPWDAENYDDFSEKMKQSEKNFIENF